MIDVKVILRILVRIEFTLELEYKLKSTPQVIKEKTINPIYKHANSKNSWIMLKRRANENTKIKVIY